MLRILPIALLASILATAAARADIIDTFDVNGTYTEPSSGTFSGTLDIDVTSGVVTAADITFSGGGEFNQFQTTFTEGADVTLVVDDNEGDELDLALATTTPDSLVGYAGGAIDGDNVNGGQRGGNNGNQRGGTAAYDSFDGNVSLATPTPEPSSLLLLASALGCLGVGFLKRLRVFK